MKSKKSNIIFLILLGIFLIILPFITGDYAKHLFINILMWATIGTAWNLLAGYTGQVSFGHAAFFGFGAYTSALLYFHLHISPWYGLLLGGIVASILAIPIGLICFRLKGPFFALATLAVGEIVRHIATIWESFTQGMVGIIIHGYKIDKIGFYFVALGITVITITGVWYIMHKTRYGYFFLAIRENQDSAEAMGINTNYYKNLSLIISAFATGVMGAFYSIYMGYIDPEVVFSLPHISIKAILVAIIGGVATITGPAIGSIIMIGIEEALRSSFFGLLPQWIANTHALIFGILVIIVILYLPGGIVGDWQTIKKKFRKE
jgi:branched-chain amino acid transport system permease protein